MTEHDSRAVGTDRTTHPFAPPGRAVVEGGGLHPPREVLDRDLRAITDEILRMGGLVEEAIRRALQALVDHDADLALQVIIGDRRMNEAQRRVSTLITTTIATQSPVARDLRFLLTLDHVSYELERMGDHAGSVAKQARKLAPTRRCSATSTCPRWPRRWPASSTASCGPSSTSTREPPASSRPATTRSTPSITGPSTRSSTSCGPIRTTSIAAHANPLRRPLPGADRRPGDEHRRGRRLPPTGEIEDLNP